ncbi:hypothetical protein SLEP1_g598 [Rubroshorea leprosula]|uniref:Uncharacterized protein n=1 Tax=Rubroshorea leprosula TaxID=152421 RepID=A0AAV5HK11_9ROSI|nr:hypothetical protein SLEP1_g598 [Rubroshorea leprosula]
MKIFKDEDSRFIIIASHLGSLCWQNKLRMHKLK